MAPDFCDMEHEFFCGPWPIRGHGAAAEHRRGACAQHGLAPCSTRLLRLLSRRSELTEEASIVCPYPFLNEAPLIVKPENV